MVISSKQSDNEYGVLKIDIVGSTTAVQNTVSSTLETLRTMQDRLRNLINDSIKKTKSRKIILVREDGDAAWLVSKETDLLIDFAKNVFFITQRDNKEYSKSGLKGKILAFRIAIDLDEVQFIPQTAEPEEAINFLTYAATRCSRIESEIKPFTIGITNRFYDSLEKSNKELFGKAVEIKGKNEFESYQIAHLSNFDSNTLKPMDSILNEDAIFSSYDSNPINTVLLYDRKSITQATKSILEKSDGIFYQTHFLSNPINAEEDYLNLIGSKSLELPNLGTYTRIIGISNKDDLDFAERSIDYNNRSDITTEVKLLKSIELSSQVDRLPNFAISDNVAMLSFPSRRDKEAFAIIISGKESVSKLKLWLENFGKNLPIAGKNLTDIREEIEKSSRGYLNQWVINIINWALVSKFGDYIKCISIIGSFSDPDSDPITISDMDLLIVIDNDQELLIPRIKNVIKDISNFFSRDGDYFKPNYFEGPVYDDLFSRNIQLIHVMINSPKNIERWPEQIKRYRKAQHRNLYGKILPFIKTDDTKKMSHYLSEDFGFKGLKRSLEKESINYRTWNADKRENYRYHINKTATSLTYFSLYCIIKSLSNLNDLKFSPGYYDKWNGRVENLYHSIIKNSPEKKWSEIFEESISLQREIRSGEYKPSTTEAEQWKNKAIKLIDDIINYLDSEVHDKRT